MNKISLVFILTLILFFQPARSLSLNITINTTPLSAWLNNETIHYRYVDLNYTPFTSIEINPLFANFTETYNNFYYLGNYTENNTNTGTIFRLATIAYPQPFVVSMLENNFSACSSNSINTTQAGSFFQYLCSLYRLQFKVNLSENESANEINNTIRELVATTMPNDPFTKQLYSLFYNYSSVCNKNNTFSYTLNGSLSGKDGYYSVSYNPNASSIVVYSKCRGSPTNPALPYFGDYFKYISSLQAYMNIINNYTPQILYDSLKYDMKLSNVFPIQKTPALIEDNIALLAVYPGAIPSGLDAEQMLNYSPLGLPINYFKNNNITELTNNGVFVYSGVYPNITMFVAVRNAINNYSYYNISPSGYPFSGSLSAGPIKYYDSCSGGIGYYNATQNEIRQMKSEAFHSLASYDLYPFNLYSEMKSDFNVSSPYGPSIIAAVPNKISIRTNNITYGALYYNKTIAYESNTTIQFSPKENLLSLVIPTNAIKNKSNVHQLFAILNNNYSYVMNYYGFNTYFSEPKFTITSGSYQKTETKVVNNKTITYTITCYTESVSGSMSYNSSLTKIGSKQISENVRKRTYINVSTNMSISKVFNVDNNGYANKLNYSFVSYISSSPNFKSFADISIPTGTTFTISSENYTPLIEFTASYPINATITGYGNRSLILYAPTYVFPNIYQNMVYYYPTISTYANNNQYNTTLKAYELNINSGGIIGGLIGAINVVVRGAESVLLHTLINKNITNSPSYLIISGEHQSAEYYMEGCPYTRIGNVCIAPPPQYTLTPNQTQSQSNFNLLNPILYTENMYYSSAESPSWLCAKVDFWKHVLSPLFPSVNQWSTCQKTPKNSWIKAIFFTNSQLLFNETWANFTPQEKQIFLKDLLNESTYTNYTYYGPGISNQYSLSTESRQAGKVYSIVFPQSYINKVTNLTSSIIVGKNTNIKLTGNYKTLHLNECVFDMCYYTTLVPTQVYTTLYYKYIYNGNYTYTVSVYPNEYENASMKISNYIHVPATVNISIIYTPYPVNLSQTTLYFTAPSTFYIKEISSQDISLKFENNTLYVYAPALSYYKLNFKFGEEVLPSVMNNTYNFLILPQNFTITNSVAQAYSKSEWLAFLILLIIGILLWKTKYFQSAIDSIKAKFKIQE